MAWASRNFLENINNLLQFTHRNDTELEVMYSCYFLDCFSKSRVSYR